jgi:uncharacterized protein YdcH (DUF465 family)
VDRENFLSRIQEIGQCEDVTDRISLLTALSDEVSKIYDDVDSLNDTIKTLNETSTKDKEQIDKLQKANMDLFLRVGTTKTQEEVNQTSTGIEKEPDKRKFEDLFNNEGGEK